MVSSGGQVYLPDMNTGDNNQWGALFAKLIPGFVGVYFGGSGGQLNTQLSGSVLLGDTWNFDPNYAFGGAPAGPTVSTFTSVFYDNYAKVFFDNVNAYGNGYQDALMAAYTQGGPLVPVANPDGTDVSSINITLLDDHEPSNVIASGGYVQPVINDVTQGPYVTPLAGQGPGLTLALAFGVGQYTLGSNTSATLGLYKGTSNGVAVFETKSFTSSGGGLFQSWSFDSASSSLTAAGSSESAGANVSLRNLPYATCVN